MNIIMAPAYARRTLLLLSCLLLALTAVGASAQNAFRGIGFIPGYSASEALGISGDGNTVVGDADGPGGTQAIRWTSSGGVQSLNAPGFTSYATGASQDGGVIAGYFSSDHTEAFMWNGSVTPLGTFVDATDSQAAGVSADGAVVVGYCTGGLMSSEAFRWTSGGMGHLPVPLGTLQSQANGISADGQVIVGSIITLTGETHAVRWTTSGMEDLGSLNPSSPNDSAVAASQDGSVIVGTSSIGGSLQAFRWTQSVGMVAIVSSTGSDLANDVS